VKTGKGGALSWHRKDREKVVVEKARARQAAEEVGVEAVVWVRPEIACVPNAERHRLMSLEIHALTSNVPNAGAQ